MKVAPILKALRAHPEVRSLLVHTGQHYDFAMSQAFFRDLDLPAPDEFLNVGSGTHAEQTARIMTAFEPILARERPNWVLVVGDVNSTLACALSAAKLHVPLAHVEAGLRSFDRTMPEEINRLATDSLADLLLTPSADADANLRREGVAAARIRCVGNVMIDALCEHLPAARALGRPAALGLAPRAYAVLTLHRPSNVDDPTILGRIAIGLRRVAAQAPVIFPVHPRARTAVAAVLGAEALSLGAAAPDAARPPGLYVADPLPYLEFLGLTAEAGVVLTDSGGLQEETTALGVPCVTIREHTERPITVTTGTNLLVGTDPERLAAAALEALAGRGKRGALPPLWDGRTAPRIVHELLAPRTGRAAGLPAPPSAFDSTTPKGS
ncbi:MAG: UDP-N-acetylglucosamine 2-epimerase (non-hydrolyzing) [Planctomycetes bacterium]|nr:UDP-N-acetylglucosamine 2-epimerase (non-hydrolyzing) [Planctomycetota bacterium]